MISLCNIFLTKFMFFCGGLRRRGKRILPTSLFFKNLLIIIFLMFDVRHINEAEQRLHHKYIDVEYSKTMRKY